MSNKTLTIKIDKKFIDQCLYQEDYGRISLDEDELKQSISKLIAKEARDAIEKVVREAMIVSVKEHKKLLSNTVKAYIQSMSSSELFYRDEFRSYLVDLARSEEKAIQSKIKAFIEMPD